MIGYNFRLGEIECAIGIEQLKKLPSLITSRQHLANKLTEGLQSLLGLRPPVVSPECTHVYYTYPILLDTKLLGTSTDLLHSALVAEGVPLGRRYQNIHLLPIFQNKIAYGSKGFPWTSDICGRDVDYRKGICPVAEGLHDSDFLVLGMCNYDYSEQDIDYLVSAFHKVWSAFGIQ